MTGHLARLAALALALAACAPPRTRRAPADQVMSLGIVDGNLGLPVPGGQPANGGAPQSASKVRLAFRGGAPGPFTVVPALAETPPGLDDGPDDPAWAGAAASHVPLVPPGEAIGMARDAFEAAWLDGTGHAQAWDNGVHFALVKAAYDERNLYLLVQWADPTPSRGWRDWVALDGAFARTARDEDRVYLAFDVEGSTPRFESVGCAAACHVADAAAAGGRFTMHTDGAAQRLDAWVWRAARTGPLGLAEVAHVDGAGLRFACEDAAACAAPYADNADGASPAAPLSMAEAGVDADPAALFLAESDPAGLFAARGLPAAAPFSRAAAPRDGSTLPGARLQVPSARRVEVRASGRWADGVWTLSLARPLVSADPDAAQFPLR